MATQFLCCLPQACCRAPRTSPASAVRDDGAPSARYPGPRGRRRRRPGALFSIAGGHSIALGARLAGLSAVALRRAALRPIGGIGALLVLAPYC
eukprot:2432533-Alexandrium_andersonii.AAC.1